MLKTKDKKNKVYYDGNFWTHPRWARPGKKVPIGRSFYWDEKFWLIPAVYICRKGLVVDFCIRIQREEWQTFFKKRGSADGMAPHEKEDPLSYEFGAYLWVDGRRVSYAHGCSMVWASDTVEADEITQLLLEREREITVLKQKTKELQKELDRYITHEIGHDSLSL